MLAQFVFNKCLILLSSNRSKFKLKVLLTIRKFLVKTINPVVKYNFYSDYIQIPLSHDLPFNRAILPKYSDNFGRVVEALSDIHSNLKIIDVGANIGDTVCIAKNYANVPLLCVEGNDEYLKFLNLNTKKYTDIEIAKVFLGESNNYKYSINTNLGTSNIEIDDKNGGEIDLISLDNLLVLHENFANSQLLKIDTDGFDNSIIRSGSNYLMLTKPVIFFEYDPYFLKKLNENGKDIFEYLEHVGYSKMTLFDNRGDFYCNVDLCDKKEIDRIHLIADKKEGLEYFDICIYNQTYSSKLSNYFLNK